MTDRENFEAERLAIGFCESRSYEEGGKEWSQCSDAFTTGYRMAQAARTGGEVEPVAYMRFRSHRIAIDDCIEGLEQCDKGDFGDDGSPALPVFDHPAPAAKVSDGWRCRFIKVMGEMQSELEDFHDDPIPSELWSLWRELLDTAPAPAAKVSEATERIAVLESRYNTAVFLEDNLRSISGCDKAADECARVAKGYKLDIEHHFASAPQPVGDGKDYKSLYSELVHSVETKFPNETCHQTILRYIGNAERGSDRAFLRPGQPPEGGQ